MSANIIFIDFLTINNQKNKKRAAYQGMTHHIQGFNYHQG